MLETVRGLVRPTITWVILGAAVVMAFLQQLGYGQAPDWFIGLVGQVGTFWFLAKQAEKWFNNSRE